MDDGEGSDEARDSGSHETGDSRDDVTTDDITTDDDIDRHDDINDDITTDDDIDSHDDITDDITDDEPTVPEFVDYCRLQARLCAGTIETLQTEIEDLLDELDADLADLRDRLSDGDFLEGTETTERPESTATASADEPDTDELADAESAVETKQALVEAKQARLAAYQDLASGYADLAADLRDDVKDASTAVERIVSFEVERDAPAYFEERQTLAEAVVESADDG